MSGRVLRFEGSVHVEVERLLPWLVNGTLQDNERALVEQHLAECAQCRREAEWQRTLQSAHDAEADTDADATQAWQRMRRRVEEERVGRRAAVSKTGTHGWGRRRSWWRWAVAVQASVILMLGVMLIQRNPPVAVYRTLGAAQPQSTHLVVVFDPHVSEAQMRSLLRAGNARIVDGPTATGAYVLSVPTAGVANVREALRAAPGVTLVENLSSGSER
ncbi:zf-HC2 domain-containing protein [Dyella tabacisoli]|uniref:Zf-HC2 domain-containing protein n=1 Tax=Dyella tabacisoli TaxID=2282381 RepID=A0A369UM73_9GAMM|nr:zf-HC2 domain-containing protein [Dyella tabacisoli]RDD81443.1 zf-HC2 domain-containing protein [Dyella tabacisoli]